MQNKILIALLAIVLYTACKKNTTEEPKKDYSPTQTGQNILYCKINGEEHVYQGKKTYLDDNGVNAWISKFSDEIYAITIHADDSKYNDGISMHVNLNFETQNYILPELGVPYPIFSGYKNIYPEYTEYTTGTTEYPIDSSASYITFSRIDDNIISGTFNFIAVSKDGTKTVTATDGFFDIERRN